MKIPLKGGTEHEVTDLDLRMLKDSFPRVDVEEQLRVLIQWNRDNPSRRKTPRGIRKHISSWLARAQERTKHIKPGTYASSHKPIERGIPKTSEADKNAAIAHMARLKAIQEGR